MGWLVWDQEVGGEDAEGLRDGGVGRRVEEAANEGDGGVDPEDWEDAGEPVIEEGAGGGGLAEFASR